MRTRLIACYVTIAACVPYLTLKIAWLSGSTVGWNDKAAAEDSALYVGNAITLGMDAVAVLVALAFTYRWGQRLPAWLVIVPIWIATGLLSPIMIAAPADAVLALFTDTTAVSSDNALQGWVYAMVYSGFTVQGIGLLTAFVLYARVRWADLFRLRTGEVPRGATHPLQVVLANTAAVLAVLYASFQFFWAFGGTAGLSSEQLAERTAAAQLTNGVWGGLTLIGAAGLLTLVRRRGTGALWRPLIAAWTGAGGVFAWSLYMLLVTLGQPDFLDDSTPLGNLTIVMGVFAGLIMGLVGAVLLTELQGKPDGQQDAVGDLEAAGLAEDGDKVRALGAA